MTQKENLRLRRGWAFAALALAVTLVLALPALSQGERPGPGERGGRDFAHLKAIAFALELTPEQQSAAKAILQDAAAQGAPLRDELRTNRAALREALGAADPDVVTVGELTLAGADLRSQLRELRQAAADEIGALLDADQLDDYEAIQSYRNALRKLRR